MDTRSRYALPFALLEPTAAPLAVRAAEPLPLQRGQRLAARASAVRGGGASGMHDVDVRRVIEAGRRVGMVAMPRDGRVDPQRRAAGP